MLLSTPSMGIVAPNAHTIVTAAIALLVLVSATTIDNVEASYAEAPRTLVPGGATRSGSLTPGTWASFSVPNTNFICENKGGFVTFRVWDTSRVSMQNSTSSSKASHGADALLIAGEGSSWLDTWMEAPPASVSARQNYWAVDEGLHADFTGFQILRPYHSVVRPAAASGADISVAVYNVDEWVQTDLDYVVSAECSGSLGSCVAPGGPLAPRCSGKGTCRHTSGVCSCDRGWGGIGCEYETQELIPGAPAQTATLEGSQWKYFVYYAKDDSSSDTVSGVESSTNSTTSTVVKTVTIEMQRLNGQTVLFSKPREKGQSPYDMINIYDYNSFADVSSYKMRQEFHSRTFTVNLSDDDDSEGVYYIAIFNNNNPLYGASTVLVSATETVHSVEQIADLPSSGPGAAPGDDDEVVSPGTNGTDTSLTPQPTPVPVPNVDSIPAVPTTYTTCAMTPCYFGTCSMVGFDAKCFCNPGYAGTACNTPLHAMQLGESISGTVPGGMWKYHVLKLGGANGAFSVSALPFGPLQPFSSDLMVTFKRYGGQGVLVSKLGTDGALPDAQTNDFLFTTPNYNPNIEQFKIGAYDLYMGNYIFAVHNAGGMGTFMNYVLNVELSRDESWFPKSMLHLAIGVFAAFCLLVLFVIYKKVVYRNANMTIVQAVINAVTLAGTRPQQQRQGLDTEAIEAFETIKYAAGMDVKGGNQCMVCLSDFEEGDELRLMPGCGHAFHVKCVDPWLQQNHTCPTCRRELGPTHTQATNASTAGSNDAADGARDGLVAPSMTASAAGSNSNVDTNTNTASATTRVSAMGDVHVVISDVETGSGSVNSTVGDLEMGRVITHSPRNARVAPVASTLPLDGQWQRHGPETATVTMLEDGQMTPLSRGSTGSTSPVYDTLGTAQPGNGGARRLSPPGTPDPSEEADSSGSQD